MKQHRVSGLAFVCLASMIISCQKEDLPASEPQASAITEAPAADSSLSVANVADMSNTLATTVTTTTSSAFALPYSRSISFNRANGTYGLTQANADLGPTSYWKVTTSSQTQTSNNTLQTTLLKNSLTTGSVMSKIDIPDGATYSITYDMMFASDFDFSLGGKLGFGLLVGDGNRGGDPGWDGNGGSLRLSWSKNTATGAVTLQPDVYYKDQPSSFGNTFGKKFPATGSLQKGVWYKVVMYVKSNTGTSTDGSVQLTVNGTTVLNQSIRWTTNSLKRLVNSISFENFRGGSTTSFQSATDGKIFYDNVVIKSSAPTTTTVSPTPTPTPTPEPTPTPTTGISTRTVNWDNRTSGSYYGLTQAVSDFGNANYWQQRSSSQSQVYNGMLKTTLLANSLTSGGVLSRSSIAPGSQYELSFDMQFGSNFDFSYGGKVGYGLFIGDGNTGGDAAWDGNGGSLRLMWQKKSGYTVLIPYVYYKDQPGTYGNDFGKKFPATGSIQKGVWYKVKMYVKSNSGSNTDGRVQVVINGVTLIDQPIRWTTNSLKRLVNSLCFETFRGGAESYWQSSTNGDIYFDNLKLVQLAL